LTQAVNSHTRPRYPAPRRYGMSKQSVTVKDAGGSRVTVICWNWELGNILIVLKVCLTKTLNPEPVILSGAKNLTSLARLTRDPSPVPQDDKAGEIVGRELVLPAVAVVAWYVFGY
jgi:hypothetical protein